ncbi:MAG: DUF6049 family protein [Bifidobacteriaceae bacterium]|nr:DUF6049 family protein [Bifidobacteriaceae bacterium]
MPARPSLPLAPRPCSIRAARWRFALAACLGLALAAGPATSAIAVEDDTTVSARVTIDEVTAYVDESTPEVHVGGTIVNTGTASIVGEINLRLANQPFADQDEVTAWQDAGIDSYDAWVVSAHVLDAPLEPGVTLPFRFDVPREQFGFDAVNGFDWGPLGIVVDLATSLRSVAAARSFVLYAPRDEIGQPLELSIGLPLVARIGESPADAATRAAVAVAATAAGSVDWIVDPRLTLDDAEVGAGRAGSVLAAAISSHADRRSIFAVPWGDVDVSALAHGVDGGAESLFRLARSLARSTVQTQLPELASTIRDDLVWPSDPVDGQLLKLVGRVGQDLTVASTPQTTVPRPSLTASPPSGSPGGGADGGAGRGSPSITAGETPSILPANPLSDTEGTAQGAAPGAAPSDSTSQSISPTTPPELERALAERRAIAGSQAPGGSPTASPSDPVRLSKWPARVQLTTAGAGAAGLVPDPELTSAIAGGTPGATDAVAAQYTAALLAMRVEIFHAGKATGSAVAIVPRTAGAPVAAIAARAEHVLSLPWIEPVPLADAVDSAAGPALHLDAGEDPGRGPDGAVLSDLNDAAHQLNAFAKLTTDPDTLMAEWSPRLLAPINGSVIPASERTRMAMEAAESAAQLAESVGPVEGTHVTMISATSELPVVIDNTSPMDVELTVGLHASTQALVTDKTVDVALEPDTRATVRVPVHAIANGDVDVTVHLLNPDGEDVANPSTFRVRVHAEWENIGTAIFSGLIGVLFVFGLIRAILRRRRERAATPPAQ